MHGPAGRPIDAHFNVDSRDGQYVVVFHSRSGSRLRKPRNLDYALGLELLLSRLSTLDATVEDLRVDSRNARGLSAERCRLLIEFPYPLELRDIKDTQALRLQITGAQRAAGIASLPAGGRTGSGAWKRIAFWLSRPTSRNIDLAALTEAVAFAGLDEDSASASYTGSLEGGTSATSRREQTTLRKRLFGTVDVAGCSLCGRELPVHLLVAAHIKPRATCSDLEKRDLDNIAMRACLLGCDALYERGHIAVGEDGRVVVDATVRGVEALVSVTQLLDRRVCSAYRPQTAGYFRWHYDHTHMRHADSSG